MFEMFRKNDYKKFWEKNGRFANPYMLTDAMVRECQKQLGYKLPRTYIDILRTSNGGIPRNKYYHLRNDSAEEGSHIVVRYIKGINGEYGINDTQNGSPRLIEKFGYPNTGIVVALSDAAGGIGIMLDYSHCGKKGEPIVTYVDTVTESQPIITELAGDFDGFIRNLVDESAVDNETEDELINDMNKVSLGQFSEMLKEMCEKSKIDKIEDKIRHIAREIVLRKGRFVLHDDELSYFLYDIQFMLYYDWKRISTKDDFLENYAFILVSDSEFTTGGYSASFVKYWFKNRIERNLIIFTNEGYVFLPEYRTELERKLRRY